jgi:ABC-type nitrate/sulfonate/bicarbonate transport system substrate-binding protein
VALVTTFFVSACGGQASSGTGDASLMLDFPPNAVHAGIYTAVARDYDGAESVRLRVRRPGRSTDPVRLLESGRVDFAIVSISDLAIARAKGAEVVGVMAVVQRPLAAVFAPPGVSSPRQLEGRRAGVSGLPSNAAVLESVVRGDGGDPRRVRTTDVGFNAVPALVGGRVDAVTALWNVEGLELKDRVRGVREFRVDRYGAPAYPELVLCTTARTVQDEPELVQGLVDALRRGYGETLADPESAAEAMMGRVDGLDRAKLLRQLHAVSPAFTAGAPRYGLLNRKRLTEWSTWAAEFGIVDEPPNVAATFAPRFAEAGDG